MTDPQPKIDEARALVAELKSLLNALIDERAAIDTSNAVVTPREAMEVLREHCLRQVLAGRGVAFHNGDYVVHADPDPGKYEGAWNLHGNHREWHEPLQNVVAQVRQATMFALNLEPALGEPR